MKTHELNEILARADAAINDEDFDRLMQFYAADATLAVQPGLNVTGRDAIRRAFERIASYFNHTLHVSQREVMVIEGGDSALVLARTHVAATFADGKAYDAERRATYVFRRGGPGGWECVVDNSYGTELLARSP